MNTKIEHTTIRNNNLFCLNCGGKFPLAFPIPVDELPKKIEAFNSLHADCKPTWKEPQADQSQDIKERAMFWLNNCHVGMSSKTMWNFFMDNKHFPINHPYDPDDFSRCYKLLQVVPEWEKELYRLKPLSKAWSNLVDNWPKLKAMFEENERTQWKNHKKIGMYEFMQTLIN